VLPAPWLIQWVAMMGDGRMVESGGSLQKLRDELVERSLLKNPDPK
jgi:hypothetical protein